MSMHIFVANMTFLASIALVGAFAGIGFFSGVVFVCKVLNLKPLPTITLNGVCVKVVDVPHGKEPT